MSLESPATYGEWYWALQVDASKTFADESEKVLAPFISGILGDIPDPDLLPTSIQNLLDAVREPPSFAFLPLLTGIGLGAASEAIDIAFEPLMLKLKRTYGKRFKSQWLSVEEANILWLRKKIPEVLWDQIIAGAGYEDEVGSARFEAEIPYPTIPELVSYSRYHGRADAPWGEFQNWYNIPPRDWPVWKWLGEQKLTTLQIQTLRKREHLKSDQAVIELRKLGWAGTDPDTVLDMSWTYPNAMLQTQGMLLQGKDDKLILADIARCDVHPSMAKTYLDGVLTKPSSADIVAYQLRHDPSLSGLDPELRKIGIHKTYWPVYKELAQQIPPLPDIITMAVREAFSPAIAARFGQYEDFPEEFATWAAKKGLTEDWSKRYWAAHWNLPSPSQGFEMLHRGVIDNADLNMLMRAQDIMPFWRDKLVQIAYRPLTRVDVRRMYKLGVLSESEVVGAYLDAGYDDRNAGRMAEFTVKQTLATQAKFSASDIVKAFTNRIITASMARTLLVDIGVRSEDAQYVVSTAQYKRKWAFTEQQIRGIRNLYKKREYNENKARGELAILNLPGEQIDVLMKQWWYETKEEPVKTWTTAQTLGFMKAEIIGRDRAIRELKLIGYDDEHIDAYMSEK